MPKDKTSEQRPGGGERASHYNIEGKTFQVKKL